MLPPFGWYFRRVECGSELVISVSGEVRREETAVRLKKYHTDCAAQCTRSDTNEHDGFPVLALRRTPYAADSHRAAYYSIPSRDQSEAPLPWSGYRTVSAVYCSTPSLCGGLCAGHEDRAPRK